MIEYREFRAMNTDIVLAAEGAPEQLAPGFERARAFIAACEARFTRFAETSELATLNRSAGTWFHASPELYDAVREACAFVDETGGLFDPAILDALENIGYDRSMDDLRAHGAARPSPAANVPRVDTRAIEFDNDARGIRLPPGLRLDLGGIAKGWIAERAADELARYTCACAVNAGGDMFARGLPPGESAWAVALEDPRDPAETLAVLRLPPGAVATSSVTKRRWQQGDAVRHHLIDPRTRLPAETDWLSVTAIAPHATTAEVYAKALLIGGSRSAPDFAGRSDLAFIAVDATGRLRGSKHAREFLDESIEHA